jgi:hypothetical protein
MTPSPNLDPGLVRESSCFDSAPNLGPTEALTMQGREEARAVAVSDERLPGVAHAGPAGDGDLRAAGGETRQNAEPGVL